MNERLFARLAALLASEAVVLASVTEARGATPRERGSRMLIGKNATEFSVGGGLAEARVIAAARELLDAHRMLGEVQIDLTGRDGSAGVCGGTMKVLLRRWEGAADLQRASAIAEALRDGQRVSLGAADSDGATETEIVYPDPRLLIVGAGHCALALYDYAQALEFDIWVHDEREACFAAGQFPSARHLCGNGALLADALQTERDVYAVLVNRDFPTDVAALAVLGQRPPVFLGMMGSRKRIASVRAALPELELPDLIAPVGLDIDAETPHEIAVSILAQVIQRRRRRERARD